MTKEKYTNSEWEKLDGSKRMEILIAAWKRLDSESKKPVGAKKVAASLGVSIYWIAKDLRPQGGLTPMKLKHHIRLCPQESPPSYDESMSTLDDAISDLGRVPPWGVLLDRTGISESTWKKRIGGRRGCSQEDVYRQYLDWKLKIDPESPNVKIVQEFLQTPPTQEQPVPTAREGTGTPTHVRSAGRVYGPRIDFGNMPFAPTVSRG